MRYKVISFDMFQTLVDVNARKYDVWAEILKDEYTKEKADMFWSNTLKISSEYTNDMKCGRATFQPMHKTFSACYEKLFKEHNINFDTMSAVNILFHEHGRSLVYSDAKDFFDSLDARYTIWISSDTDRAMITPLLELFKHEYAFLSEDIEVYKQDEQGRFFKHILQKTGVDPQSVIHVGDGLADILGAKRAGISACWLNREGKEWNHPIKPDYIIQSLLELNSIVS